MSKERESKRRSPSIIARLMGVEGLPPQHAAHKQHKKSSESYQHRTECIGLARKITSNEGCSFRKSSKEKQEFKDVFEVLETTKLDSSSYPVQRDVNSKLTEAKMAFFRQKVMDAKRLSTDEKLQGSKEFDDTLEVLDSNKDLFLKCLQERNSLFGKHLHDLQVAPPQSHCRHEVVRKTSEVLRRDSNSTGFILDRETMLKNHTTSRQEHCDGSLIRPCDRGTHNAVKSSRFRLEDEDETSPFPTRIVVLKPNLGRAQSVSKSVSSPDSAHAFLSDNRMLTELPNVNGKEAELRRKKINADDEGILGQKSKESREIAKKITGRMKNSLSAGSLNFSSSGFKGYAGDESSCYFSGNDSATESEVTTLTSRQSFVWNDRHGLLSSHSSDSSSVNREAKKRLSERWKMTHRFQEVGLVGRSSTLGEMLAIPDREVKAEILDSIIDQDRSARFAGIEGSAEGVCPLGISSKEGWKEGCMRNLSGSRSLPASSAAFGSPKVSLRRGTLGDDRYLMSKETVNLGINKAAKKDPNRKEDSFSSISRSAARKTKSSQYTDREDSGTAQKNHVCQNQMKTSLEEDVQSEQTITILETSICNVTERSLVVDAVVDVEHENMVLSSESPDELPAERSACISVRDDSPTLDLDNSVAKETSNGPSVEGSVPLSRAVCEPESPASSKEAEQPSPVSVLETPFPHDLTSGSECFGSLSADLQGLRMQLQLLKLESEEYAEGSMVISSDEDVEEESTVVMEEREIFRTEESWESSYVVDVLIGSGFGDADPDTFMATWHSPECPIDYSIFQKLEKKYFDQTSWLRSERRLLFDRINAGLVEIFQQFLDPHPWVKPLERRVGPKRSKDVLEDDLCKLLSSQEKKANKDPAGKVLGRESQWLDLEDDIDMIGRELERLLIDELVVEVLTI